MKNKNFQRIRAENKLAPGKVLLGLVLLILSSLSSYPQSPVDIVWTTNVTRYSGFLSVAFSPDNTKLASGSENGVASIWSIPSGSLLWQVYVPDGNWVKALAFSHNGNYLASGGGGITALWRVSDGYRLWASGPGASSYSLDFSPDDVFIAYARSDAMGILHASSGLGTGFDVYEPKGYQIIYSPDGTLLASANADWTASLFRMPEGTLVRNLNGHSNEVYSMDFSADGTLLLTASIDGTARLWRVADGEVIRVFEGAGGKVAKFSADERAFFSLNAGIIRLWRVDNGRLIQSYSTWGEKESSASCLAVAPNGQYFAYGTDSFWGTPGVLVLAWTPVWISDITRAEHETTLTCYGGSGVYQLQQNTDFRSGSWDNVGMPYSTNVITIPPGGSNVFYRVLNLTP